MPTPAYTWGCTSDRMVTYAACAVTNWCHSRSCRRTDLLQRASSSRAKETDKDDLHAAIGSWGAELMLTTFAPIAVLDAPLSERINLASAEYIKLISEHPQVFRLLVRRPGGGDPFAGGRAEIALSLSRWFGAALREIGADAGGAEPWA